MRKFMKRILIVLVALIVLGGVVYYWFPGYLLESVKYAIRWRAGLEKYEIQVDDHSWVYLEGGGGETILFVHGFGADKDRWGPLLIDLSGSHRLIVPDLPGFGESSQVQSASYDIPSQVKRLNRFVETIKVDTFHMVGISMGGGIAAYYATEYPNKVKSLVLIDAAGVKSRIPSDTWRRYKEDGKILLLYKTPEQFDELLAVIFHRPPWIPAHLKAHIAKIGARNYDFRKKILNDLLKGGTAGLLENRLSRVKSKVLIIWGANDRIIHVSSVEKFERGLKNHQTVIIDNSGHVPYLEKPEETKRAIREFLDSL
jgi:pimeloyl-ACP methyl ester carboxylesterase